MVDHLLHQEARGTRIDGEDPLPKFRRHVGDRCAVGDAGGIDEAVDAAEARQRLGDDPVRRVNLGPNPRG